MTSGLSVAGVVYAANAAAIGVAWYTVLQKSAFGIPARVRPVQMAGVAVLVVALIAAAWLVASRRAAGSSRENRSGRASEPLGSQANRAPARLRVLCGQCPGLELCPVRALSGSSPRPQRCCGSRSCWSPRARTR
jgi:hypothetical protein